MLECGNTRPDPSQPWYDFGDDWYHTVAVKAILPRTPALPIPCCVKAARACPPEDCGGPWGYADVIDVLADPAREEYERMVERVGDDFDPEQVDLERINRRLTTLARR